MLTFFSRVKHYLGVNFCFTDPWEMYIAEETTHVNSCSSSLFHHRQVPI